MTFERERKGERRAPSFLPLLPLKRGRSWYREEETHRFSLTEITLVPELFNVAGDSFVVLEELLLEPWSLFRVREEELDGLSGNGVFLRVLESLREEEEREGVSLVDQRTRGKESGGQDR